MSALPLVLAVVLLFAALVGVGWVGSESEAELRARIANSDYWELGDDTKTVRDTDEARQFFARFAARDYAGLLDELEGSDPTMGLLRRAERSTRWDSSPLIVKYEATFLAVLRELRTRTS